jgi:glycosyltransferase involved in cell wall biosynthesis
MMIYVFWLSLAFIAYTLVGYPTLLWLISLLKGRSHRKGDILPSVTIIVVVHNAAETVADKIKNTLEFDYPRDKLEVIIGSDGSTDATPQIVESFADEGVRLVKSTQWSGKHHVQMLARDVARGEILVFTDVSIRIGPEVLKKMVAHFADSTIGCVCSVDDMQDAKKGRTGESFYVYGEMGLRALEARVSSLVSLSGSLFAVRRSMCDKWHPDQSSDFFLALHAVTRGLRAILDPECRAQVGVVRSESAELARKVRTIVHGLVVFFTHLRLLNPFRYGLFSWQLVSHKLFRWLLPFAVMAALISNLFLWKEGRIYQLALIAQLLGYVAALISHATVRLGQVSLFKLAGFFVLGNAATLVAWWKFCRGEKLVTWKPSHRG